MAPAAIGSGTAIVSDTTRERASHRRSIAVKMLGVEDGMRLATAGRRGQQ
jgi:hypothetical protein